MKNALNLTHLASGQKIIVPMALHPVATPLAQNSGEGSFVYTTAFPGGVAVKETVSAINEITGPWYEKFGAFSRETN